MMVEGFVIGGLFLLVLILIIQLGCIRDAANERLIAEIKSIRNDLTIANERLRRMEPREGRQ